METEDDEDMNLMPCPNCKFVGKFLATITDEPGELVDYECPKCHYEFVLPE